MSDEEVRTEDQYIASLERDRDAYQLEALTWEHKVSQLTKERDGLLELNQILESDRRTLIQENQELRNATA